MKILIKKGEGDLIFNVLAGNPSVINWYCDTGDNRVISRVPVCVTRVSGNLLPHELMLKGKDLLLFRKRSKFKLPYWDKKFCGINRMKDN